MYLPVIEPALYNPSRSAPTTMTAIFHLTDRKKDTYIYVQNEAKVEKPCLICQMTSALICRLSDYQIIQGGSNMTGTDLCVNKPQCAAAVRP